MKVYQSILGITICGILILISTDSYSQEPFKGRRNRERDEPQKAHEMMETLKIWRLTEELNINSELAERFFPKVRELEKQRMEHENEIRKCLENLRNLSVKDNKTSEINQEISKYFEMRERHHHETDAMIKEILKLLTPVQQAKYLIFEDEFPRKIREFMRQHKRRPHDMTDSSEQVPENIPGN
ncbi:hypothetical protein JW979_08150 [bacterium]|nr:hypothetical protein [candidate division CSSED10-310 bacterium]